MTPLLIVLSIFFTLLFTILALSYLKNQKEVTEYLQAKFRTARQESTPEKMTRHKQMQMNFKDRVLFPLARRVYDNIRKFIPMSSESWVRTHLLQAGFQKPHDLKIFIGIQVLLTITCFTGIFFYVSLTNNFKMAISLLFAILFGIVGFILPLLWLKRRVRLRRTAIQKSLPDFLDLLVISVEAGMALDTAINKIAHLKIKKKDPPLYDELNRYIRDIGLGKSRVDALTDLGHRTGVEDFNGLLIALAQSFEMGTSVTKVLRVHSDILRDKRLERAKETANKLPVKMVIPIYIFLFPSIFLSIFGPIGMMLYNTFIKNF